MAKNSGLNFSALAKDANQEKIQIGSSFVTQDATLVPQSSPLAYTTAVIALVVPDNAVEVILNPSTNINVSTSPTLTSYDVIASGSKEAIGVSRQQTIYLQAAGVGTLNFRFTTV